MEQERKAISPYSSIPILRLLQLTFPRALSSTFAWFTCSDRHERGFDTQHQVAIFTDCDTTRLKNSRADQSQAVPLDADVRFHFLSRHSFLIAFFDCEDPGAFSGVLFVPLSENGLKLRVWFENLEGRTVR